MAAGLDVLTNSFSVFYKISFKQLHPIPQFLSISPHPQAFELHPWQIQKINIPNSLLNLIYILQFHFPLGERERKRGKGDYQYAYLDLASCFTVSEHHCSIIL